MSVPQIGMTIKNKYSGATQTLDFLYSQAEWDALQAAGWEIYTPPPAGETPPPTIPSPITVTTSGCLIGAVLMPFRLISLLLTR